MLLIDYFFYSDNRIQSQVDVSKVETQFHVIMHHVLQLYPGHHQLNVLHVPRQILNNLLVVEHDLVNLFLKDADLTYRVTVASVYFFVKPVKDVTQLCHAIDDIFVAATEQGLNCSCNVGHNSILVRHTSN